MTYIDLNAIGIIARERQQELMEAAAEQRLVRRARAAHPSRWNRRAEPSTPPDAA